MQQSLCAHRGQTSWHGCTVEYSNWMMGQCTGTFYFGTCDFLIGRRRSMMTMIESFKLEINQRPRDYYHIVLTLPQSHKIKLLLLFTFTCSYVSGYLLNGWHFVLYLPRLLHLSMALQYLEGGNLITKAFLAAAHSSLQIVDHQSNKICTNTSIDRSSSFRN